MDKVEIELPKLPKIFIYKVAGDFNKVTVYALAEDGSALVIDHTAPIYARAALTGVRARNVYRSHYPDGYSLVELLDKNHNELMQHRDLVEALILNAASNNG